MGNKRVYLGSETSKYAKLIGIPLITITSLFLVLMAVGFEITGSNDQCLGTKDDPCISYGKICNLGPDNYDIYNPDSIKLDFSPEIKDYWMFFKDGRVKKQFLYDLGVNADTAGWRYENFTNATKPRSDRVYVHRFARYSCQDYMIVGLKNNPEDIIKWGFGVKGEYLDPFWYAVNETPNTEITSLNLELGTEINITTNLSGASTVCVDIDHPDYGDNYTCGSPNANFLFNISYFRKTEFNDSTTNKSFDFNEIIHKIHKCSNIWDGGSCDQINDGDWNTYESPDIYGTYKVNYTIPLGYTYETENWTIKTGTGIYNVQIPSQCWNSKLQLQVDARESAFPVNYDVILYCYNSTDFDIFYTIEGDSLGDSAIYEESIFDGYLWTDNNASFYISGNQYDEIRNVSINLSGEETNNTYPTNIRIYINNSLSNSLGTIYSTGEEIYKDNLDDYLKGGINISYPYINTSDCANPSCDNDFDTMYYYTSASNITNTYAVPENISAAWLRVKSYAEGLFFTPSCFDEISGNYFEFSGGYDYLKIPPGCYEGKEFVKIRIRHPSGNVYDSGIIWYYTGEEFEIPFFRQSFKQFYFKIPFNSIVSNVTFNISGGYSPESLDQYSTEEDYGYTLTNSSYYSQSFNSTMDKISSISLKLRKKGTPPSNITLKIGTSPNDNSLYSGEIDKNLIESSTYNYFVKKDVGEIEITAGNQYFITLSATGTTTDGIVWASSSLGTNPYPKGFANVNGTNISIDFAFKEYGIDLPSNIYLDVGFDGDYEFNYSGDFSSEETIENLTDQINNYIDSCSQDSDGNCYIPIYFISSTPGKINISKINLTYNYNINPIYLNKELIESFLGNSSGQVDIPITIISDLNGTLQIDDIRYDYRGGNDTINILTYSLMENNSYYESNEFNNTLTEENLTFIVGGNFTRYITIPNQSTVYNAIMNISGNYYNGTLELYDNFNDNSLNQSLWSNSSTSNPCGGGSCTVSNVETNNELQQKATGYVSYTVSGNSAYQKAELVANTSGASFNWTIKSYTTSRSCGGSGCKARARDTIRYGATVIIDKSQCTDDCSTGGTALPQTYGDLIIGDYILNKTNSTHWGLYIDGSFVRSFASLSGNLTFDSEIHIYSADGSASATANITLDDVYTNVPSLPLNPYLEVGTPNGEYEWNWTGSFFGSNQTNNFSSAINSAINSGACDCNECSLDGENCSVPLLFNSSIGVLELSSINISYFIPEIVGNYSNNNTLNLNVYHSAFEYVLPYDWTDNIFFLPRTNSSKNVTAYGQTTIKPLYNITGTNYGGKDFNMSVRLNESFSCINISYNSTGNSKPTNQILNTSWQEIKSDVGFLENFGVWFWADLDNCNASDKRILNPKIELQSYCEDCIWSGQ